MDGGQLLARGELYYFSQENGITVISCHSLEFKRKHHGNL